MVLKIFPIAFRGFISIIFFLVTFNISAQESIPHEDRVSDKDHDVLKGDHRFKNAIGVFMGTTVVPTIIGADKHTEILFVPTYGIQYGRIINSWFGIGLHNEFELQNYVIENEQGDLLNRSYIYVGSILLYVMPIRHLVFFAGPGVELTSEHNFEVFKFGIEYAMYRGDGNGWYIAPEISADMVANLYTTFSFGIVAGKGF